MKLANTKSSCRLEVSIPDTTEGLDPGKNAVRLSQKLVSAKTPRRWRAPDGHVGCYFPETDLSIGQMGNRGTGAPVGVEWIDPIDDLPWVGQ